MASIKDVTGARKRRVKYERRECLVCEAEFFVRNNKADTNQRCCSKSCSISATHAKHKREGRRPRHMGSKKPELRPTTSPTFQDIHFAAGLFEGEGSSHKPYSGVSARVHMSQKDPEILYFLRDRFGGRVTYRPPRNGRNEIYDWQASGTHARFFLKGMYPLMSERRKRQIENVMNWPEQPVQHRCVDPDMSGDATELFQEQDICWAAGIYEGEGSCQNPNGYVGQSGCSVHVMQKDPEILHKLRGFFGGKVTFRAARKHTGEIFDWQVYGPRARRFLKGMYPIMSERRKGQIDNVLGWKAA